jgi:hypothetical protein
MLLNIRHFKKWNDLIRYVSKNANILKKRSSKMYKIFLLILCIIFFCGNALADEQLKQIENLIEKYGKREIANFILSKSWDRKITIQVGNKLSMFSGSPGFEYITTHSISNDFKQLNISEESADIAISNFIKQKNETNNSTSTKKSQEIKFSSNLSPYNYSYEQLRELDIDTLHQMHSEIYNKIAPLHKRQRMIMDKRFNALKSYGPGSRTLELLVLDYDKIQVTLDKYSKFFDDIGREITFKRGIEATIKLDNNDWSSASDIESLIEDKVEMDMLLWDMLHD